MSQRSPDDANRRGRDGRREEDGEEMGKRWGGGVEREEGREQASRVRRAGRERKGERREGGQSVSVSQDQISDGVRISIDLH